jgi:hypothetical protein
LTELGGAATAPPLVADEKVLRGRNGRLFVDNDTNEVVRQHTGELKLSGRQLRDWRVLLENRCAWLERRGTPYFFLVPPNAHSVYPEDLPEDVPSAGRRPVHQLIEHVDAHSYARIIYPLEELLAAKPNELLYAKTDTHWTALGAWIAYRRLAAEVGDAVPMHTVREEDLRHWQKEIPGELGVKVDPPTASTRVWAAVERPLAHLVADNRVINRGMILETECAEAPDTKCLVLGDSFAIGLHPFLASSFRRLVFVHMPTLDYEVVEQVAPDVVISVLNERFLISIPYDVGAPSTLDLIRQKTEEGMLREPSSLWSDPGDARP